MVVKEIEFMDKNIKEAIVKVGNDTFEIVCFSCPCELKCGDIINNPLECVDVCNIMLSINITEVAQKISYFGYKLQGVIVEKKKGLVETNGILFHINEDQLPGDCYNGCYISFETNRIDIW